MLRHEYWFTNSTARCENFHSFVIILREFTFFVNWLYLIHLYLIYIKISFYRKFSFSTFTILMTLRTNKCYAKILKLKDLCFSGIHISYHLSFPFRLRTHRRTRLTFWILNNHDFNFWWDVLHTMIEEFEESVAYLIILELLGAGSSAGPLPSPIPSPPHIGAHNLPIRCSQWVESVCLENIIAFIKCSNMLIDCCICC